MEIISPDEWARLLHHGYALVRADGQRCALRYDPRTGATILVPVLIRTGQGAGPEIRAGGTS